MFHRFSSTRPLSRAPLVRSRPCAWSKRLSAPALRVDQVDSDGKLLASFKQQLSPLTLLTLAAQIDTVDLNSGKHKFGMALKLTP